MKSSNKFCLYIFIVFRTCKEGLIWLSSRGVLMLFFAAGTSTWRTNHFFQFYYMQWNEVRTIEDDQYDVEKGLFIKTQRRKGVGRVGEGIEVTAVLWYLCMRYLAGRIGQGRRGWKGSQDYWGWSIWCGEGIIYKNSEAEGCGTRWRRNR